MLVFQPFFSPPHSHDNGEGDCEPKPRAPASLTPMQLDQNATVDPLKVLSIDLHSKGLSAVPPVAKVAFQHCVE